MADDEQQGGGSPAWMMTYGDAVTLLLTFFLLLLTFSSPNEEDFAALSRGMLAGSRRMSLFGGGTSVVPGEIRMAEERLSDDGAEKPSESTDAVLDELKYHYEDIDISRLPDLEGALVIRIPLADLFGSGGELADQGYLILGRIVKMAKAKPYAIVVRTVLPEDVPAEDRPQRALQMSVRVAGDIRDRTGKPNMDVTVSNNVSLARPDPDPGLCEIIMLEV
jgi:chemotaxis protein MotB